MNIFIVEDEPIIAADLKNQLVKLGHTVVGHSESGEEAIGLAKKVNVDVFLLDIQLDGNLDGVDTAHEISKVCDASIIYLTSNTDERTFSRAKFTQPAAYLSKPFRTMDIARAIDLTIEHTSAAAMDVNVDDRVVTSVLSDRIFIRNKGTLQKVMLPEILLIEADGAYCKIITTQKEFMITSTLKKFVEECRYEKLIRVHRSYAVNVDQVDQMSEGYVVLGDHQVPVGRSYKDILAHYFRAL